VRLDLTHVVALLIVGFAGFYLGRNVPLPGDD
jgi:hypothetical protein